MANKRRCLVCRSDYLVVVVVVKTDFRSCSVASVVTLSEKPNYGRRDLASLAATNFLADYS